MIFFSRVDSKVSFAVGAHHTGVSDRDAKASRARSSGVTRGCGGQQPPCDHPPASAAAAAPPSSAGRRLEDHAFVAGVQRRLHGAFGTDVWF
jgi:hypothetical protein